MSLMVRLSSDTMLRKSLISLADQAVVSGTNFAITVLLGRACGKPEVGLYYLALQAFMLARGVQEQVIVSPLLVYGGRKQADEFKAYAGSSLVHELIYIALVATLLLVVALTGVCTGELGDLLWLLVGAAPLMLLREFIRQMSFGQLRVGQALAIDVAVCTLQLAGLACLVEVGLLTTLSTFIVLALGCALPVLVVTLVRRGSFAAHANRLWPDWRNNWRFARWALASQLLGQSMPLVLPWVVAGTHGEAATGSLGVGTTLIGFANMFVLGMSNFVCPQAAKAYATGGKRDLVNVLQKAAGTYLLVLVPFAAAMLLCGPWLMTMIYGPDFADAGQIMGVLAVGAVANSLGIAAGNGLWAMDLPSANFRADACAMLTWLVTTALLVPWLGAYGAALASAAGTIVGSAVRGGVLLAELRRAT
jgi:O-antigen/teichoic acid export membrane protein